MTIAQITAILYLLVAFGVPQPTVDTVQTILLSANKQAYTIPMPDQTSAPVAGTSAAPAQDCTPILEAQVTKFEGDITTGFGLMFMGTSTLPAGCILDTSMPVTLQLPSVKYTGTPGNLVGNGQAKFIPGTVNGEGHMVGFTYKQGFGTPPGVVPQGDVVWTVGSSTLTIKISI